MSKDCCDSDCPSNCPFAPCGRHKNHRCPHSPSKQRMVEGPPRHLPPTEHKKDWEEELHFGIMEDYLRDAQLDPENLIKLREHWEKLKSFIRSLLTTENTEAFRKGQEVGIRQVLQMIKNEFGIREHL